MIFPCMFHTFINYPLNCNWYSNSSEKKSSPLQLLDSITSSHTFIRNFSTVLILVDYSLPSLSLLALSLSLSLWRILWSQNYQVNFNFSVFSLDFFSPILSVFKSSKVPSVPSCHKDLPVLVLVMT